MEKPSTDDRRSNSPPPGRRRGLNPLFVLALVMLVALFLFIRPYPARSVIEDYNYFLKLIEEDRVLSVERYGKEKAYGVFKDPPPLEPPLDADGKPKADPQPLEKHFLVTLDPGDTAQNHLSELLRKHNVANEHKPASSETTVFVFWGIALAIMIGMFAFAWMSLRRRDQMMGAGFLSGFSKSPAKRYEATQQSVTFRDVAGLESIKADLQAIVEFLTEPA